MDVQRSVGVTTMDLEPGGRHALLEPAVDPDRHPEGSPETRRTIDHLRHVAGLDGIRAIAVLGVLGFHAGVGWFGGGLLGVDIFFVLSGYLITSLLMGEWSGSGTIAFLRFYERRARRLLPGLFILLLLVAAYARWFTAPDGLGTLRNDGLSTMAYVANWRFVFSGQSYFVHFGPPSPLLHTWSLAVEEQFYLVWPAVALFVLRRRGRRALGMVAAAGLVLSSAWTAALFHAGVSVSRLYYGTDVRTQEVMMGALLAVALPAIKRRSSRASTGARSGTGPAPGAELRRRPRWVLTAFGTFGALALIWALHVVTGQGNFLYNGGFSLVAVATGAVILLVTLQPKAMVSRVLSIGVLGYIGRISYGLYLYHFPLFMMIDHGHTGLSGWALLTVRMTVTGAAAVLSYHLIEIPIRNRTVLPGWHVAAAIPVAMLIAAAVLVVSTAPPPPVSTTLNGTREATLALPLTRPTLPSGRRVKVLLVGDSLALTLGLGLGVHSEAWGVELDDQGVLGCDLDPHSTISFEGSITKASQQCLDWQGLWQQLVNDYDPDVVAVELGRWEVSDRIVNGTWTRIGEPAWDRLYSSELGQAIRILSSRGAHVVVFTLPYITETTEAPNGSAWDVNQPVRTNAYNAVVRGTVARYPNVASVIDLNKMLDPKGTYTSYIDGIRVRDSDNEHPSVLGGELLRPMILPTLLKLGSSHEASRPVNIPPRPAY